MQADRRCVRLVNNQHFEAVIELVQRNLNMQAADIEVSKRLFARKEHR